jgi:hypothetical protein
MLSITYDFEIGKSGTKTEEGRFTDSQQRNYASPNDRGASIDFADIVAATGRLSINRKGTGTCPDDPVFSLCSVCGKDLALRASIHSSCQTRHRELTGICVP